jgi:DGQHR domain-containing protein
MPIDLIYLKTPIPCIQGYYGSRLITYTTQVPPAHIANLLGHDPRSQNWKKLPKEVGDIYKYLQRPTSKSRRESVAGYIEERFGPDQITVGAFPAISIAFRDPVEFVPSEGMKGVGQVMLDISPSVVRILIDGLGRVTGMLDLLDEELASLLNFQLPLTIYAPAPGTPPLSWREMGQLFHDFNFRVQPVPQRLALALDTADPYVQLARELARYRFLADHGGVAERVASLGNKSTQLVVQTVWVRTVRGAAEGRKFQEANLAHIDSPNLSTGNEGELRESIASYFQALADYMGDERWEDRDGLHLTSPGWQALGVVHHDIVYRAKLGPTDRDKVIKRIAEIDWSRSNPDWFALGIGMPEIDKVTGEQVVDNLGRPRIALTGAGRTNTQAILTFVRQKSGLDLLLDPDELAADAA